MVEWIGCNNSKVYCPNLFICGVATSVKLYYCSGELCSPYFINCNAIYETGRQGCRSLRIYRKRYRYINLKFGHQFFKIIRLFHSICVSRHSTKFSFNFLKVINHIDKLYLLQQLIHLQQALQDSGLNRKYLCEYPHL